MDPELHGALAHLRKESLDVYNRLHSIAEDAEFVREVCSMFERDGGIPVVPNLRCGAWYVDPHLAHSAPAYFKSTDGHTNNWSFNLRRANLHLLEVIATQGGLILVDSTRSGKSMPDALSKTVPIWCAVVNRAVDLRRRREGGWTWSEALGGGPASPCIVNHSSPLGFPPGSFQDWDTSFYTPPQVVSPQEHAQINAKLDDWAESLAASSFFLPNLEAPLRPVWVTPHTRKLPLVPRKTTRENPGTVELNEHNDAPKPPTFYPIVCITASKQVAGAERRPSGYTYVQGSGDDHELWSRGLTPAVFWENKDELLSADRGELESIIKRAVDLKGDISTQKQASPGPTPIDKVNNRILICSLSDLPDYVLAPIHQSPTNSTAPDDTAYIMLSPSLSNSVSSADVTDRPILTRSLPTGKKGQLAFLDLLPICVAFIRTQLSESRRVCIACPTGTDASVGVALTALMCCFGKVPLTKQSVRTRLEWIISSRPQANPARTTLKRVNEFLLSDPSMRTR